MTQLPEPVAPPEPDASSDSSTESSLAAAALPVAANGVALLHLGLVAAGGVTRLAASTHATIARLPLPWRGEPAPAEQAPAPYQLVEQGFGWLAGQTRRLAKALPVEPQSGLLHSALNGVVGHTLAELDSPLAAGMSLRNEFGAEIGSIDWVRDARRGLVLFVHGLCLSEREWQNHEHAGFVRELRDFGYGVAWLRYNTGRAIADNGAALAELLQALPGHPLPITLIGHSMGGLVIRAAAYHADIKSLSWLEQLKHAAYLGTPHQGAALERLGSAANRLLGLTPYTRPFMQLGDIRSRGIRDLREGRIVPEHKANPYRLPAQARHLLIAGHMRQGKQRHLLGDGLVTVRSALGQHVEKNRALHGGEITRVELEGMGHMAMLKDERVYEALLQWLKP
jgi:pimeloyl-ACP methyl ester carboxylesterase